MKKLFLFCAVLFFMSCDEATENSTWYLTDGDENSEMSYVNEQGETMVIAGKYAYIFTDTFTQMAIVMTKENRCIAIDKQEKELFEVYFYDNGPDYIMDGLFRIKDGEKIGYANKDGKIVIAPQYKCTTPFENGKAQVAYECDLKPDGEHTLMTNAKFFYIDTKGNKIEGADE